ncbi:conserved hypothetical protein [Rhodopseudomonas palustris HaA2]|uniref:Uncharacterized protein n=1 Tax=Rhodopseudomonas palustris (strain HaA2) TaxID=316058 RepID=Q2IVC4_RHOP2|nr:ferritin family protein [Rhodopseudomonas palustris]ABD07836.1 conserved hypothetical protein [Rhodopseudomonas palustris HaA2]
MARASLLTAVPTAAITEPFALYAVALDLAERAHRHYGALAARVDENFRPVRCVFEVLTARERERVGSLIAACEQDCGRVPTPRDRPWVAPDLVPESELSDIEQSSLSTPYTAWAIAVQHRQRAFVFWTYVIAVAMDAEVRSVAEGFAREALADGNLLRRERRAAWRAIRGPRQPDGEFATRPPSAALLESLLLKDIAAWAQHLTAREREFLATLAPSPLPPSGQPHEAIVEASPLDQISSRALHRAEQLSDLYLDDADRAIDQSSLELAQKLAAQSIARLAGLRRVAAASTAIDRS